MIRNSYFDRVLETLVSERWGPLKTIPESIESIPAKHTFCYPMAKTNPIVLNSFPKIPTECAGSRFFALNVCDENCFQIGGFLKVEL